MIVGWGSCCSIGGDSCSLVIVMVVVVAVVMCNDSDSWLR